MNKKKLVLVLTILFFGLTAATYILFILGKATYFQANIPYMISGYLAILSAAAALKLYHLSSKEGVVFALLLAGVVGFSLGDNIFAYFQFFTDSEPFPSIADYFFIAGYPLIFIGLVKEAIRRKVSWHDFSKFALTLVVLFGLTLAILVAYFGIYGVYDPAEPFINNAILIGYNIGDIILLIPLFFILKVAVDFKGGKLFYSWIMVFAAIMFLLFADILFAIYTDQYENEEPIHTTIIDLGYTAMYLLFAYSFFFTTQTVKDLQAKLRKPKPAAAVPPTVTKNQQL